MKRLAIKSWSKIGRLGYFILLPVIRIFIRHTKRSYLLIRHDNEVLVVKNWLGRQSWHLPGGGIKPNEQPKESVIREVKEELGIKVEVKDLKLICKNQWETDDLGFNYYIFSVDRKNKFKPNIRKFEILDYNWLNIKNLDDKNCSAEIQQAVKALIDSYKV